MAWEENIQQNEKYFTRSEVCIMEECTKRELIHKARDNGDFSFTHIRRTDQDGYTYCIYCQRISARSFTQVLIQCPDCSRFFKGPVRRLKTPVDWECDECMV